jgi:hypothetical protein
MVTFIKYLFPALLLAALSCTTQFSFGQKPVFGIKLGVALSNATIKMNPDPGGYSYSTKAGLLGGIYVDLSMAKQLLFRPGAEVVFKGARERYINAGYNYPIRLTFFDIPINILYKGKVGTGYILAGGGPVISVPLNNSYYNNYACKTYFGVNGMVGYEVAMGFSINLNYCYGLTNASKNKQYISKISNRYLGISVGYSF